MLIKCDGLLLFLFYQDDESTLALSSVLLILAIAEAVVTIWSASLCCGVICSCCRCCRCPPASAPPQRNRAPRLDAQPPPMLPGMVPSGGVYPVGQQFLVQGQYACM